MRRIGLRKNQLGFYESLPFDERYDEEAFYAELVGEPELAPGWEGAPDEVRAHETSDAESGTRTRVHEPMTPRASLDQLAQGVDVSAYQRNVNWPGAAMDNKRFVIIKATEGRRQDGMFAQHWRDSGAAGLIRGAYHLLRPPWEVSASDQVDNYLSQVHLTPGADLPPCLDIEVARIYQMADPDGSRGINKKERYHTRQRAMTRQQITAFIAEWCTICEDRSSGWRPILYLGPWSIHYLRRGGRVAIDSLTRYDLWFVYYTRRDTAPPRQPIGWPQQWSFWQYRGNRGRSQGFPGAVDLDRFNGTYADLQRYVATNHP